MRHRRRSRAGRRAASRSQARHPASLPPVQHRQPRAEPGGDPLVHAPFFNGLGGAARQLQPVPCLPDTKGQGLDRVPVQPELEGSLPLSPVDLRGAVYGPACQLCRSRQRRGPCPPAAPEGQTGQDRTAVRPVGGDAARKAQPADGSPLRQRETRPSRWAAEQFSFPCSIRPSRLRAARTARGWGSDATASAGGTAPGEFLQGAQKGGLGPAPSDRGPRPPREAGGPSLPAGQTGRGHGLQLGQHPVTQAVAGDASSRLVESSRQGRPQRRYASISSRRQTVGAGSHPPDGRRSPQSAQSGPRIRWSRMVSALSPALWAVAIHWPPQAWAVRRRKS